jgi:hypothetical protein
MNPDILQEKIASLPEEVQRQLIDYIDFLVQRYQDTSLTEPEKQMLESRYQSHLNNPSQSSDLDEVKNRLMKKYELPSLS